MSCVLDAAGGGRSVLATICRRAVHARRGTERREAEAGLERGRRKAAEPLPGENALLACHELPEGTICFPSPANFSRASNLDIAGALPR